MPNPSNTSLAATAIPARGSSASVEDRLGLNIPWTSIYPWETGTSPGNSFERVSRITPRRS